MAILFSALETNRWQHIFKLMISENRESTIFPKMSVFSPVEINIKFTGMCGNHTHIRGRKKWQL